MSSVSPTRIRRPSVAGLVLMAAAALVLLVLILLLPSR
jgi:hypothetical protein